MNQLGHGSRLGLGLNPPLHLEPNLVAETNISEKYNSLGGMYISRLPNANLVSTWSNDESTKSRQTLQLTVCVQETSNIAQCSRT